MGEGIKESDSRRLDFLLADYGKTKDEIARRSGLQERAIALYFAVVAYAVIQVGAVEVLSVTVTWVAGWLALAYYVREHAEIGRLGKLIRERVAEPAAQLLGSSSVDVIPSESQNGDSQIDSFAHCLDRRFMWVSFGIIPFVLSCLAIWHANNAWRLLDPRYPLVIQSVGTIIAAVGVIRMLRRAFGRRPTSVRSFPLYGKKADA